MLYHLKLRNWQIGSKIRKCRMNLYSSVSSQWFLLIQEDFFKKSVLVMSLMLHIVLRLERNLGDDISYLFRC